MAEEEFIYTEEPAAGFLFVGAITDEMVVRGAQALAQRKFPYRATGLLKEKLMRECLEDARAVLTAVLEKSEASDG